MPVKIHGNQYITVVERMELMRQSEKPFEIVESMPVQVGDRCVWRVAILLGGCKFYGSAECHFNAKPGTADATDPFACAETSAIGRALGFAGYGAVESIASADEVVRNQELASQPAKPAIAPVQPANEQIGDASPVVQRMIEVAKARCEKIGKPWPAIKAEALGKVVQDAEIVVQDFTHINGLITKYERQAQKAS